MNISLDINIGQIILGCIGATSLMVALYGADRVKDTFGKISYSILIILGFIALSCLTVLLIGFLHNSLVMLIPWREWKMTGYPLSGLLIIGLIFSFRRYLWISFSNDSDFLKLLKAQAWIGGFCALMIIFLWLF